MTQEKTENLTGPIIIVRNWVNSLKIFPRIKHQDSETFKCIIIQEKNNSNFTWPFENRKYPSQSHFYKASNFIR